MSASPVPLRGYIVTAAGMAVNLCLGILYAWSVWKAALLPPKDKGIDPGMEMTGLNVGWHFLSDSQATWAYSICGFTFALCMIPGGRLQDRFGPRLGATLAGLFLGAGCILAGEFRSFLGLILGFGILGGIGMGLGYAAATPAAVRWFGPHRRGLIVGLVVAGYGGAAVYISPLAKWLIESEGISGSFYWLGGLFAAVIVLAAQFLKMPPPGYAVASPAPTANKPATAPAVDLTPKQALGTWQLFALVFMFIGSAQAGLLVIANATIILTDSAKGIAFIAANLWLLSAYGGVVNATGRAGTGFYSDAIGRTNAFALNGIAAVVSLLLLNWAMEEKNVFVLFVLVGIIYWQYGGTLALLPAWTADFFGAKNMGVNYGLVFLGWGIAFFIPLGAGFVKEARGSLELPLLGSAGLLFAALVVSRFVKRPTG